MSTLDFTLAFILLCILKGCTSQVCKPYEDSQIQNDCDELIIGGGTVCYIATRLGRWEANITCLEGYDLLGTPTRFCQSFLWIFWARTWDESQTNCVREQRSTTSPSPEQRSTTSQTSEQRSTTSQTSVSEKRGSFFVVFITVPTVAIVILAIVSVVVVLFYRRRKLTEKVRSKNITSAVTNSTYDGNVDARYKNSILPGSVDNIDSEYFDIPDSVYQNISESEYSTLHMDDQGYNASYYNMPQRRDTNDHTTRTVGNVQ